MKPLRLAVVLALVLGMSFAVAGCSFLTPGPTQTPSPSPTAVDTTKYIGGEIDPVDTVWSGKDSGGDLTTLTLHGDGTLAVSYGTNSYDYPGDTWYVADGVLHAEVFLDETNGLAEYVATWNPVTSALDAVMRTTRTAKQLTVNLIQQ